MVVTSCPLEVDLPALTAAATATATTTVSGTVAAASTAGDSNSCGVDSSENERLKGMLRDFMNSDGSGVWVPNFSPFWLSDGTKALCSKCQAQPTNCSQDDYCSSAGTHVVFNDSAVRVVEIVQHSLGLSGVVAVVELVHQRNWGEIARYVVLDVEKLRRMVRCEGEAVPGSDENNNRLQILDSNVSETS